MLRHLSFRRCERIVAAFCPGLNDPENEIRGSACLQHGKSPAKLSDDDIPACHVVIFVIGQPGSAEIDFFQSSNQMCSYTINNRSTCIKYIKLGKGNCLYICSLCTDMTHIYIDQGSGLVILSVCGLIMNISVPLQTLNENKNTLLSNNDNIVFIVYL